MKGDEKLIVFPVPKSDVDVFNFNGRYFINYILY